MAQAHHPLTLLLLTATLSLAGCAAPSPRPSPQSWPTIPPPSGSAPPAGPAPGEPLTPAPRPPPPPRENHLSPATQSLVSQARTLMTHGDLDAASSTLDRALRIEPNNPLLWIERGRLRLTESDAHQAEGCARKALALASGDPRAQRQAGRVLADALRAERRNQEARDVESLPFMR